MSKRAGLEPAQGSFPYGLSKPGRLPIPPPLRSQRCGGVFVLKGFKGLNAKLKTIASKNRICCLNCNSENKY
jgi:hypothetical protein